MYFQYLNHTRQMLLVGFFTCLSFVAFSQDKEEKKSNFSLRGFMDVYYGYDFQDPNSGERYPFLYNHNRKNRLAVNLALILANYEKERIRASLGLQQGTYAQDNYSSEPKGLRWIHQANVGYALNSEKTVWLDAGVLPSHIGFESAISTENLTLSRSIIAENSPYFETGIQLSWQKNERWYFALLYLNGWQQIQGIPGRNKPSFGTQATFTPSPKLKINWSTFLGTDQNNAAGTMLYFSNFFADMSLGSGWRLIAGLDVGTRTLEMESARNWWGSSLILHRQISERIATAIRYEYYQDPFQAIAASTINEGIQTGGFSLNTDWNMTKTLTFRIEGKYFKAPSEFNLGVPNGSNTNFFLLGSLAWNWKRNKAN